jgi:hypothetical protein
MRNCACIVAMQAQLRNPYMKKPHEPFHQPSVAFPALTYTRASIKACQHVALAPLPALILFGTG